MTKFHPPWFDPSQCGPDDCVLSNLLERNARDLPERPAFVFESGESWTWQETLTHTRATAAALSARGVSSGDKVIGWLPSGPELIRTWFATNYLGGIFVPINTAYKGGLLEHVIRLCDARIIVAHVDLVERLNEIGSTQLERAIILNGPCPHSSDLDMIMEDGRALDGDPADAPEAAELKSSDAQVIIFTSGTTGPSKGVLCPYLQTCATGRLVYGYISEQDCIYIDLPMFHVGGISPTMAALFAGSSSVIKDGFRTHKFLDDIRANGCTACSGLIGSMAAFLASRDPSPEDADNPLRNVTLAPLNAQAITLSKRYQFNLYSGFNMTEISGPLMTSKNCTVEGSMGHPRSGAQCRIVNSNGTDCATGETGELLVRTTNRFEMNIGYYNMPEETARAWRGGWFHTGDLVMKDENGEFFFVDRLKDAIRRRGENISSVEVEVEAYSHPDVGEVAAFGVPSINGEEEVMIAVVAKTDHKLDARELTLHLTKRLPYYCVPRYVRIMETLPHTSSNKITKVDIRKEGVTKDTWDREGAGIVLKKEHLQN